jgi:hypothetical protein
MMFFLFELGKRPHEVVSTTPGLTAQKRANAERYERFLLMAAAGTLECEAEMLTRKEGQRLS